MNYEDVQKLSGAALNKVNLLKSDFIKYFMRAIMAGFFIDVAMIYSNVVGNVFSKTMPEQGKFLGALVFSIAVFRFYSKEVVLRSVLDSAKGPCSKYSDTS